MYLTCFLRISQLYSHPQQSHHFLLYGRDPQLPTDNALSPPVGRHTMDLDNYKSRVLLAMSSAWKMAQEIYRKYERSRRINMIKGQGTLYLQLEIVYKPAICSGPAYKLTRPYKGPY